jgi:serine/threonine protein kinase
MSEQAARWDRVKQVFQSALDRPPEERTRFLDEICGADRALQRGVESLLVAHEQAGEFAERPAIAGSSAVRVNADTATVNSVLLPGLRLGPYQVIERIGAGGKGEVYRAHDTRLGRAVAIKVLPRHIVVDAGVRLRVEREARALAALSHPHICPVFDVADRTTSTIW